jgi:hypothetical protein
MTKFKFNCDFEDGLMLIDQEHLKLLEFEHLDSLNITLDIEGKTTLTFDFPGEEWSAVWERESAVIRNFANEGKAILIFAKPDEYEVQVSILETISDFNSNHLIELPSGKLIFVSLSEVVQCLLNGLDLEFLFETNIAPGGYKLSLTPNLELKLSPSHLSHPHCENLIFMTATK